ncbi:hypothetical protein AB0F71_26960 [Kitasatospora sp. NPDC028055]|uniref:hypothetical protein n=1 Tax=Kitasatospora sp. NPDC028055 TaxID=3155653 RepID=UPI0033C58AED
MSRDETAGLRAAQLRLGRLPGYVRRPDPARRSGEKGHTYKKGWEVRFTARSEAEIAEIRDLVVAAGFAPARPFFKGHQLIQPVYGMAAVQAYLAARQAAEEHAERVELGRRRRAAGARTGATHAGGAHAAGQHAVGHAANGHPAGGHPANGHQASGHQVSGHPAGSHPANGHSAGSHPANGHQVGGHPAGAHAAAGHPSAAHATSAPGTHRCEREAAAAGAAAAAAAAAATAAQLARRRAVESFPAQVERGNTADDLTAPTEARPNP